MPADAVLVQSTPDTRGVRSPNAWGWVPRLIIPAVLVLFAAPFVALFFYSVPATDDFCKATLSFNCVPAPDVLHITWQYYTQWSPRWLTTLTQSLVMSHVNLVAAYGWLLLLVALTNLASLWYFFRTLFRIPAAKALLVASIFYCAWVAGLPSATEELYWLTGAMEYYLSLPALLLLLSLLYQRRHAAWYYFTVALLSFAIPAQHEIAGTFLCLILVAGTIFVTVRKLPAGAWYLSLGAAVLSQAIVMISPGNALRAAQEHRHLWDIAHLPKWFAHSFYHGLSWLSSPSLLVAALCIVIVMQSSQPRTLDGSPGRWLAPLGICIMLAMLFEFCLVEMASGTWSPSRVVAWFEFVFWLAFIGVLLTGLPEIGRIQFSTGAKIGASILLAVGLLGSSNYRAAVEDLRGPAQAWHRMNSLRLRPHSGTVELSAPAQYPNLAMHQLVTPDAHCWVNRCMANYLKADTVVARESKEECPQ